MILLIHINKIKLKTKLNFSVVPGPPDWHKKWEQCGYSQQSPINIDKSEAEHTDFPTLKIIFDNPGGLVTGTLKNNGQNIQDTFFQVVVIKIMKTAVPK